MNTYAEVILAKVYPKIDKIYHYTVSDELKEKIQIGSQVLIPFGKRNAIGYVVGFTDKTDVPLNKLKNIISITSDVKLFTDEMVETARWIADYYMSYFISALRTMMPPGVGRQEIRALAGKNPKSKIQNPNESQILNDKYQSKQNHLKPTEDQQKAIDLIKSSIDKQQFDKILLYGITGSGKTEVYIQTIDYVLSKGKDAIVLVPEVSFTPQFMERFKARFGDLVAVFHSYMTDKERALEWEKINSGYSKIALGTRLAVFAPVKNLGLIVMDEEYEFTFKSEMNPKYHAREVAIYRAQKNNAVFINGSATPAVETYFSAVNGQYKIAKLPCRIDNRPLPSVEVVDMREERYRKVSGKLLSEIGKSLSKKEQIILFINRRGFSTFVMCSECGHAVECPKCAVSLVFHSQGKLLKCHHCGFTCEAQVICPKCQSMSIKYFGMGTQKVELEIGKSFPSAQILRLDLDTVKDKNRYSTVIKLFEEKQADILIGTQLVTKGLDFTDIGLVGVISADTGLNLPEFRAGERTFQLLTQVAGRAGRHKIPGRVIIQTFNPDSYVITAAKGHDYEKFYKQEIEIRKELNYPPFCSLINIVVSGTDEPKVIKNTDELAQFLRNQKDIEILGPVSAAISKVRGKFRWNILLKGKDLFQMRSLVIQTLKKLPESNGVRISVDVEPLSLL